MNALISNVLTVNQMRHQFEDICRQNRQLVDILAKVHRLVGRLLSMETVVAQLTQMSPLVGQELNQLSDKLADLLAASGQKSDADCEITAEKVVATDEPSAVENKSTTGREVSEITTKSAEELSVNRRFKCYIEGCGRICNTIDSLVAHLAADHSVTVYRCTDDDLLDTCYDKLFPTPSDLQKHRQQKHCVVVVDNNNSESTVPNVSADKVVKNKRKQKPLANDNNNTKAVKRKKTTTKKMMMKKTTTKAGDQQLGGDQNDDNNGRYVVDDNTDGDSVCKICGQKFVGADRQQLWCHQKSHEIDSQCDRYITEFTNGGCKQLKKMTVYLFRQKKQFTSDRKCLVTDCSELFANRTAFSQHLVDSHGIRRVFDCLHSACDELFATRDELRTHSLTVHRKNVYKCDSHDGCDKVFDTSDKLKQHIDSSDSHQHKDDGQEDIDNENTDHSVANKINNNNNNLKRSSDQSFQCLVDTCSQVYDIQTALIDHLMDDHLIIPQVCHRSQCLGRLFIDKASYERHYDENHRNIGCQMDGCGYRTYCQSKLDDHMNSHSGRKPYRCPIDGCGATFTYKSNVSHHLNGVHESLQLRCDHPGCDRTFQNRRRLQNHKYWQHSPDPIKCTAPGCDRTFPTRTEMYQHRLKVHVEELYQCNWPGCEFQCKGTSALTQHERSHSGYRRYKCDRCQYASNSKGLFNNHLKRKHSGEQGVVV
ncbi:zinc finger protein 62 homolog [Oppia nitens]|uniref:zinc finger protein 62 homolog n=1 Tax=Oppia nitens TaxID=1686743 RepID=UPI0023DCB32F|nr:zinc finger protein 62 homolog [Oppia nitens]